MSGTNAAARLQALGLDVVAWHGSDPDGPELAPAAADLIVSGAELALLRANGFSAAVRIDDLERHYRAGLAPLQAATLPGPPGFGQGGMGGYFTFAEIEALLDHYAAAWPHLVSTKRQIGASLEGRPIHAIRISDNPNQDEGEPAVLFDALHHAREPMSAHALLWLLDHLVTGYASDAELRHLLDTREIWLAPVVNPDGYVFNQTSAPQGGGLWRKNRRASGGCFGVDLNRNYAFQWGVNDLGSSGSPCSEVFRGAGPLSEPETAAMAAFAAALDPAVVCSVHTHGDVLLFPFGFGTGALPADQALYEEHGRAMADATGYRVGSAANVVGLGNGSALDHHHALTGAMSWTPEIGASFWPPTTQMHEVAERMARAGLHLVRVAGAWIEPIALEAVEASGDGDGFAEPGETAIVRVALRNAGLRATAGGIAVTIACADPRIAVTDASAAVGALGAASSTDTGTDLKIQIALGMPPGTEVPFDIGVTFDRFTTAAPLAFVVGRPRTILADDFEQDLGWTAGVAGDTALTGRWTRSDPVEIPQGGELAQPEDDSTPSPATRCFVTGNAGIAAGMDDVDDGVTTLISPRLDLSGTLQPRVRMRRWYWCSKSDDPFTVLASNDDGASWTVLETITGQPNEWLPSEWNLAGALAPTDRVRLRFVAEDPTNNSVTEALLDDFEVVDYGAAPRTSVFGKPKPGGLVELQIAATPAAKLLVFGGTGAASLELWGLTGAFGIAPETLLSVIPLSVPSGGFVRMPLPVPDDPALIGSTFRMQSIEVRGSAIAGNVAVVTVIAG